MTTSKPMPPSSAQQSLFAADTRASPFQQQENDRVRLTKDTSGRRCLELYEVSGRDGSLPKMLLDILNSVSTRLPHRWRLKDSRSGHLLFQLAPLMPSTEEIEFGLWPTPRAKMTGNPTPKRCADKNRNLETAVAREMWPTPHGFSKDGKSNGPSGNELGRAVNHRWDGLQSHGVNVVSGSLNPMWVEVLMGFPAGWTDLTWPFPISHYWLMPRPQAKDPKKFCLHCGVELLRQKFGNRLEDRGSFLRRKYCSLTCANSKKGILTKHGYSWRARKHLKKACEACGHTKSLQAHHINQNIRNNKPINIQTLCRHCHNFWHALQKRLGWTIAGKMPFLGVGKKGLAE